MTSTLIWFSCTNRSFGFELHHGIRLPILVKGSLFGLDKNNDSGELNSTVRLVF